MSRASEVFHQQNGEVTKAFYAEMERLGPIGLVALNLFRAQKRSSRAKDYRAARFRRAAYDVKAWSIGELCRMLSLHGSMLGIGYGWKEDPKVLFGEQSSWILYVDIPQGQCSFHSPSRGLGLEYPGDWDGVKGASEQRIIDFCDSVIDRIEVVG